MPARARRLAAFLCLALPAACCTGTTASVPGSVSVECVAIESRAMGGRWPAVVVLPAAYERQPERRFPVLFLLHGAGGEHWSWVRYSALAELLASRDVICVCPNGRVYGWYVDSPYKRNSKVETHVTKELVPYIDEHFRTIPRRGARGVCGFSMGGHGALTLAAKHPDVFSSASSLSGILDITRWPRYWEIAKALGPLEENRALWAASSALGMVGQFKKAASGVRLFVDCGFGDFAYPENREFHERLERLGVPHLYKEREGEHDWRYWSSHVAEHLDFHLESFKAAEKAPEVDGRAAE